MKTGLKRVFFITILALSSTLCRAFIAAETSITPEERKTRLLHRRTKDPTYLDALSKALLESKKEIAQARAALDKEDFETARKIAFNCEDTFQDNEVYFSPIGWSKPYTWFHTEEKEAWDLVIQCYVIRRIVNHKQEELRREEKGQFTTKKGTLARSVEYALAEEFIPYNSDGRIMTVLSRIDGKRIVKDIGFNEGSLTVALRVGSDAYKVDYTEGTVTLMHPVKTVENLSSFIRHVYRPRRWPELRAREFQRVKNITAVLYFPGEQLSVEIVFARLGLSRVAFNKAAERKLWRKVKAEDGTFQDLLKTEGLYYLYRDVPDLGTPLQVLKSRSNSQ